MNSSGKSHEQIKNCSWYSSWTPNQEHYRNYTRTDSQELIWYYCSWTYQEQRCSWKILVSSWNVKILVSFNISKKVLVNPMNKLRTVHRTVLEHQIKNIVGTAQGRFPDLIKNIHVLWLKSWQFPEVWNCP
jgi:hypothetical protein